MGHFKILFATLFAVQLVNGNNVLQTENGPIRGQTVASGKVEAFLGIPYAEPPLGQLRFAKPVPKTSWNDVLDATQHPPSCVQADFGINNLLLNNANMTEDCLYLSVWIPHPKTGDDLKTIMLFIHGGGFSLGSSNMKLYDGTKLSEHGDVVVVTINYRVGYLGFYAGFTEDSPGSLGLYDQVMAIQWIKDNAKHFHGDPDNIVIFGESAGAFSVSMHQISPLSKNLFRRAILESGSAVNPLYTDSNEIVAKLSKKYANLLGCTGDDNAVDNDPKGVIDCLRNAPIESVKEAEKEMFLTEAKILLPRIGNDFLPDNTIDMFRKGHFKDSEVLMGINRDEGTLFLSMQQDGFYLIENKDVEYLFNETTAYAAIAYFMGSYDQAEVQKIIRSYLDDVSEETGYTYLKAAAEASGDIIITCGNIFQAEYQSMRDNPVFFYMFDHRTKSAPHADWIGVPHFEEVQYVFGNPMFGEFTEHEQELSRDVMDMWVTFAKTGNPNIPGSIAWPRYTREDPKYFVIGMRDRVATRPDNYRCERWRNRFRSVIDE